MAVLSGHLIILRQTGGGKGVSTGYKKGQFQMFPRGKCCNNTRVANYTLSL